MNRILPTTIALLASTSLGLAQELPAGPPVAAANARLIARIRFIVFLS